MCPKEKEKPLDLGVIPLQSLGLRASANDPDFLAPQLFKFSFSNMYAELPHSFTQLMPPSHIPRTKVLDWNGFQHQLLHIMLSTSIDPHSPNTWNFALTMTHSFRILLPL